MGLRLAFSVGAAILSPLLDPGLASAATVTGTVTAAWIPPPEPAFIVADRHVCGQSDVVYARRVEADAHGHVASVIVSIEAAEGAKLQRSNKGPGRPVVIDQVNCSFVPRVVALRIGTELRIRNSDALLHSVVVRWSDGRLACRYLMPVAGQEVSALVPRTAGDLEVSCEAGHAWSRAEVRVFEHPYFAQTDTHGMFRIQGIPKGRYRLVAWHPSLGSREQVIELGADDRVFRVAF